MNSIEYVKYSDQELIDLIVKDNDGMALEYLLFERYSKTVYHHLFRYFKANSTSIEDVKQELIVHLSKDGYKKLLKFQGRSTFNTWISRTTDHFCIDYWKGSIKKYKTEFVSIEDKPISGVMAVPYDETPEYRRILLIEAISELSRPELRLVITKTLEGYSSKEILAMFQIWYPLHANDPGCTLKRAPASVNNIDSMRMEAKIELKQILKKYDIF
jgi:RNA polymerase sigma factor (sigma-70 family)